MAASSSDIIDKMAEEFNDLTELKDYCKAQYNTIIKLSKRISKLEDENAHLKKLVEQKTPIVKTDDKPDETFKILSSEEEAICKLQLKRLQQTALERELTLEESRKVEIYSKILNTISNKPKTIEIKAKKLKDDELLAVLEGPDVNS